MSNKYSDEERKILLDLARNSIKYGLEHDSVMPIEVGKYAEILQEQRACFVTLQIKGKLRGCIGSLEAHRPLVKDLVYNAYAAAFQDPRFMPLTVDEYPELEIHISILNKPEPMQFTSEEDLVKQLRPNVDGLIMQDGMHRGTFLPSVWESLSEPQDFLKHLKLKAGLPGDYWSETMIVERYTVESIE